MTMADLKPCPFCGGRAFLERSAGANINGKKQTAAYVRCSKCYARTGRMLYGNNDPDGRTRAKNDAIDAWQKRGGKL